MKTKNSIIIKLIALSVMLFFTAACGGGGGGSDGSGSDVGAVGSLNYAPATCSEADQKDFIYDVMHDVYYWADNSPELDPQAYGTNTELVDALKYSADKWSYVISQQEYNDYYAGNDVGIGIKMATSTLTNQIFISFVYPGTPAASSVLKRGFEILSVNGYSAYDIINSDLWDEAFGPDEADYTLNITYIDNNTTGTISIDKKEFEAESAPVYAIFDNGANGKKIGYLLYLHFNANYKTDLSAPLLAFRDAGVEELIIDLRYNGGGRINAAAYLGSAIAGSSLIGQAMFYYIHNSVYESWNIGVGFFTLYDLNIDKVVFLTTGATASSSELLINSLEPYKDVYLVGSKTYGKPVGMYAFPFCSDYVVPISFQTYNSEGSGGYFNGISVDCTDSDDLAHELGDSNEYMLQSAINLLETGSCISRSTSRSVQLTQPEFKGIKRIFDAR